ILGGSCTLMGTSTNLIVNSIAKKHGFDSFSFFEFSWYGIIFFLVGLIIITFTSSFLPKKRENTLSTDYNISDYVFNVKVANDSSIIGKQFGDIPFFNDGDVNVLKLVRGNQVINDPGKYITLLKDD